MLEAGAHFDGLDIAPNPVAMCKDRVRQTPGAVGTATLGSILEPPFADETFDFVVAIGSLHHTGDLPRSIEQCRRLLKHGGSLIFMVYNAFSYRRFWQAPAETTRLWLGERRAAATTTIHRAADRYIYDANSEGEAAPHTDVVSITTLRDMCRDFQTFSASLENITEDGPFKFFRRDTLLRTFLPRFVGLDIYARASR
jgi:SAM-dependent methyltransferase